MRRRVGIGFAIAAVAVAALTWWYHRSTRSDATSGTAATSKDTRTGPRPGARGDARGPASSSIEGTITDATTKAPIAGALVCAERRTSMAAELSPEPDCASSELDGRYRIPGL